jgi:hypothetical protein
MMNLSRVLGKNFEIFSMNFYAEKMHKYIFFSNTARYGPQRAAQIKRGCKRGLLTCTALLHSGRQIPSAATLAHCATVGRG